MLNVSPVSPRARFGDVVASRKVQEASENPILITSQIESGLVARRKKSFHGVCDFQSVDKGWDSGQHRAGVQVTVPADARLKLW
jgi:hypothetical protein